MKAYKGFNADMTCLGFQYEEGKEYAAEKAVACETGFHACEYSLDVFGYYSPAEGHVFHEVELDGEFDKSEEDKVAATKIKIGARLSLASMVKAAVDFTMERIVKTNSANEERSHVEDTGDRSAATNTGYRSAATNTGDQSAATVKGKDSVAVAWGYGSAAAASKGSYIVLTEYDDNRNIIHAKMVKIDGERYKPGTMYKLVNNTVIPANEPKGGEK